MRTRVRTVRPHGWTISGLIIVAALVLYGRPQGVSGNVILVAGGVLALLALMRGARHPRLRILPWLFVLLAIGSALWSTDPRNTFALAVALAVPLFLAGQIAHYVPPDRFLAITDWTLRVVVFVSLATGALLPAIGITQRDVNSGTLRGIYEHRNGMGFIVVLAIVTLLVRRWGDRKHRLSTVALLAVYAIALVWAGSVGAIVFFLIGLVVYGAARWLAAQRPEHRGPLTIAGACFGVVVLVIGSQFIPQLLELFGRDLTFTNRIFIWQGAVEAWRAQFMFGYGWANIIGEDDAAANTISEYAGYFVRSTHNGYLATALQLGIVGLVIAVLFLLVLLVRTFRQAVATPAPMTVWSFFVVVLLIGGDFVETRAFVNLGWFLLCVVAYYSAPRRATLT